MHAFTCFEVDQQRAQVGLDFIAVYTAGDIGSKGAYSYWEGHTPARQT